MKLYGKSDMKSFDIRKIGIPAENYGNVYTGCCLYARNLIYFTSIVNE